MEKRRAKKLIVVIFLARREFIPTPFETGSVWARAIKVDGFREEHWTFADIAPIGLDGFGLKSEDDIGRGYKALT